MILPSCAYASDEDRRTGTFVSSTALSLKSTQGCQLAAASAAIYAKQEEDKKMKETQNRKFASKGLPKITSDKIVNDVESESAVELFVGGGITTPTAAARVFLSRIFHLPTVNHPILSKLENKSETQSKTERRKMSKENDKSSVPFPTSIKENNFLDFSMFLPNQEKGTEEDVVLYPITGFTLVTTTDNNSQSPEHHVHVLPPPDRSQNACRIEGVKESKTDPVYGWFSPSCQLGNLFDDDDKYITPHQVEDM